MLKSLRTSVRGVVAKILLGVLFLSFALWGVDELARTPTRNVTLAAVGSTKITAEQYSRALSIESENIRRMMGDNFSPEALRNMNVSNYVLQNLINRRLLELESKDLGIVPSDVDVVRRIRSNSMFQDNKGNFDKAIFQAMLRNMNTNEKNYVDQLRTDMAINILLDTLASVEPVSDQAAPVLLHAREEGREITLYSLGTSVVSAVAAPTDEQLQQFYKQHSAAYTAPELRTIRYVVMTQADAMRNAPNPDADLRQIYDDRIEEFRRPESRVLEQLLYSSEEQAKKAYDMAKDGTALKTVAEKLEPLNKNTISMGAVEKKNVLEAAADKVFALKQGELAEPVQSPFGWHVFRVTSIEKEKLASFEEVRATLELEVKQKQQEQALSTLANQFEDALAGGATLDEAATQFKLAVKQVGPVTDDGLDEKGKRIENLPDLDKFLDIAFKTDEKAESHMTAAKGGVFFILRVEKLEPEHLRDFAQVRPQVLEAWQQMQRHAALDETAAQLSKEFAGEGSKAELISKYKLSALGRHTVKRSTRQVAGQSLPPALLADVFRRAPNEGSGVYAITGGNYVMAVVGRAIPLNNVEKDSRLTANLADLNRQLKSVMQNELLDEYTQSLRKKYTVSIHEDVLAALLK